jgi:L-fucose isomerase-like protein
VAHVPQLQRLLHHICERGFEHHVVMTRSKTAGALAEALSKYLGWETYEHSSR